MLTRMLKSLGCVTLSFFATFCSSCDNNDECFTPPTDFVFDIRNENNRSILSDFEEEDIRLYYLDKDDRQVAVDFTKEGFIFSRQLPWLSVEGKNPFYLKTGSVTDTLQVEVFQDKSLKDCAAFFYSYVGFNGEPANLDTLNKNMPPVYVGIRK